MLLRAAAGKASARVRASPRRAPASPRGASLAARCPKSNSQPAASASSPRPPRRRRAASRRPRNASPRATRSLHTHSHTHTPSTHLVPSASPPRSRARSVAPRRAATRPPSCAAKRSARARGAIAEGGTKTALSETRRSRARAPSRPHRPAPKRAREIPLRKSLAPGARAARAPRRARARGARVFLLLVRSSERAPAAAPSHQNASNPRGAIGTPRTI